ncbi:MAG: NAD(P)H-hydrate dehydratase [Chloroflexota bacterium]|nr:NAD(P)H-hydrate dehydratase [Chloroflexota bacterium]
MKLVTADQMRALEQRADKSGNTYAMMMERAGKAVADAIAVRGGAHDQRVLVLVGPGNNGGDGLVCARYLHDAGARVSLYLWKRIANDADKNFELCRERNVATARAEEDAELKTLRQVVREADIIVDALLGTGVTRPIEGVLKKILAAVKEEIDRRGERELQELAPLLPRSPAPLRPLVVAVDLPSGLNPDTGALDPAALAADLTVTFAFPKIGQLSFPGAGAVGELIVADIGIRAEWADANAPDVATAREIAARLPARARDSHKGTFGKAMLCVGSANYAGAAFLAGGAATRAGAGLVTLALARTIYPIVAAASHETTFVVLPDDLGALIPDAVKVLRDHLGDYDALLFGCGLGRDPQTIEFVQRLLGIGTKARTQIGFSTAGEEKGETGKLPPLVIDADALFALAQSGEWWTHLKPHAAILTPHPGEMATLCGLPRAEVQADRLGIARKFAAQWQQFVVLKGAFTVVAAPDGRVTLLPFATPALATAGTGDVLAGTLVAMLAQKLALFDAAVAGAYLHGLAGEIAEREVGRAGVVAGDLLPRLPKAMRQVANLS